MKVVHLTSVHSAFDVRIFKQCRTLAGVGYEVVIVAPHAQTVTRDGVRVHPIARPSSRYRRMVVTVLNVLKAAISEKADVYTFHDPELIPAGLMLRLIGKKVIYDVHEDYPVRIQAKEWIPRRLRTAIARSFGFFEKLAARTFSGIVAATPEIARKFPGAGVALVMNFPESGWCIPAESAEYSKREPSMAYFGVISEDRGIFDMLEAAAVIGGVREIRLLLAGRLQPPNLLDTLKQMPGWKHTEYLGVLDRDEIRAALSRVRVGLSLLHATPGYAEALPTKVFEYMSACIPVVASDFPILRKVIGENQCGLLVEPGNRPEIVRAVSWLLDHPAEAKEMGQQGMHAVKADYSWEGQSQSLVSLYANLAPAIGPVQTGTARVRNV